MRRPLELARRCGVREFVTFDARRKTVHALPESG